MSKCGSVSDINVIKGTYCFNGEEDGFAIWQSEATVSNTTLSSKAYWDAQIYDSTNRVITIVGSDDSEITPGEPVEYNPKRGSKVQTSKNSAEYMIKYKDTECLRKTLDDLNGRELNVMFFTEGNFIIGVQATNTTTKTVKAQLSVSKETVDGVKLLVCKFTFVDVDFEMKYVEVEMDSGFTTDDLTGLTSIYLEFVSAIDSTGVDLIVDAFECDRTANEDLLVGNFVVYNLTDDPTKSTPIVPSGVVNSANRYTISIATQDAGDVLYCGIADPSASNLYVTGEPCTGAVT
jgi:hypothetical protein